MTVTLSIQKPYGYSYAESIPAETSGQVILIPQINNLIVTCTIVAGDSVGKFQFTTTPYNLNKSFNPVWQDWPKGDVTSISYDTLLGSVTALRGVSVSGDIAIELAGKIAPSMSSSLWCSNPTNLSDGVSDKSGVHAYLSETADTEIITVGTYYPLEGTFINDPVENFVAATIYSPGIKYIGNLTQDFFISGVLSIHTESNLTEVTAAIKKNNVIASGSAMSIYARFNDQYFLFAAQCVVELSPDDEIQIVLTADRANETLTVNSTAVSICPFFK